MNIHPYESLLKDNKSWAAERVKEQPDFFKNLTELQTPEFLWIGCSDSRVPANQITGTQPGEIFVHRNVANLVINTDVNLLSVLDYAVNYLFVKHIIVCGHYGCGGVKASMTSDDFNQVLNMVTQMDKEGFGNCTNTYACEAECPKGISVANIARMNKEFLKAGLNTEAK